MNSKIEGLWAKTYKPFFVLYLLCVCALAACTEKMEHTAKYDDLRVSNDTICFDSVFVQQVSPTQWLRVYNQNDYPIRLPSLRLLKGEESAFTLLIDGQDTRESEGLRIEGKDSLSIVIRLKPEKEPKTLPINDVIDIRTADGAHRQVHLKAWGLSYTELQEEVFEKDWDLKENTVLIITKSVEVKASATLRIPAGVQIYFKPKGSLTVFGRLEVLGTADSRVLFAGTRLDSGYKYAPGQWQGVRLMPGSGPHRMSHLTVRSAVTAFRADELLEPLQCENCIFTGSSRDAIVLRKSSLTATGCIFAQNTGSAISLRGGRVRLSFCTLSGDTRFGQGRRAPLLVVGSSAEESENMLSIENSIVWGTQSNEIRIIEPTTRNTITATHSLFKWQQDRPADAPSWDAIQYNDPKFENPGRQNYELQESSPARGAALIQLQGEGSLLKDLKGIDRLHPDGTADLGALVYSPKKP